MQRASSNPCRGRTGPSKATTICTSTPSIVLSLTSTSRSYVPSPSPTSMSYACLVCGKYFQGRGPKSHAYFHALEVGHHVYVNMQTKRVYVLPEGYEVKSKSLDDIKFVVDPRLSKEEVLKLDRDARDALDLGGKKVPAR